ncbi:hypothetical protein Ntsu_51810 [Nocardia sp. IFM 10818]
MRISGWLLVVAIFVFGRAVAPSLWDEPIKIPILILASLGVLGITNAIATRRLAHESK